MNQTLFGDHIPTNSIFGDHIKTDKYSEEEKMALMKNFLPKSQMGPTDDQIEKMAYSSGKRIVKSDKDIHRDPNQSSWDIVEENKSQKMLGRQFGNRFASSYVDEGITEIQEEKLSPEMAKQIMEKNSNYLQKGSIGSIDTKISDQSRQELLISRREKLKTKDQWMDDNVERINARIAKSRENIKKAQTAEIEEALKAKSVDPQKVTEAFKEYFKEKQTLLTQSGLDIKRHERNRSSAMKRHTNIKTSLDMPSLPTRTSGVLTNALIDNLPEELKQRLIKKNG